MPSGDRADFGPTKAWENAGSPSEGDFASPRSRSRDATAETVAQPSGASSSEASGPFDPASGAVADLDEFERALIELGLAQREELGAFQVDASLGVLGLARPWSARAGSLPTNRPRSTREKAAGS